MKQVDINNIDLSTVFLHYTNKDNIESISKNGLKPFIGENSKGIEQTKKVFFTIGDKNALIIMDAWIKWLISRPKNKYIYRLGAYFMTKWYFPKFIYDIIFRVWHKSEKKLNNAFKELNTILDNSVYLVLDLEENIDFSYDDIDEVKDNRFPKKVLKTIYVYNSDINNHKMEYWNMHTYSNKVIDKRKISLLTMNNENSVNKILSYFIENNLDYVKDNLDLLYKFYENKKDYSKANSEDIESILNLKQKIYDDMGNKDLYIISGTTRDFINDCINKSIVLKVTHKDKIIGFLISEKKIKNKELIEFLNAAPHKCIEVCNIGVDKEYRNQKIAKMLLKHLEKELRNEKNIDFLVATIHPNNSNSLKTFTSAGYKVLKKINIYNSERYIVIKKCKNKLKK